MQPLVRETVSQKQPQQRTVSEHAVPHWPLTGLGMCVCGWDWSRASQLFPSGCAKKPEKSSAAGLLHNGTGRAEGTSSPPGLDQEHAGLMWTPRATSTTPTWQDTHKLAQGKDNRANQNPQKFVFTSMYTKSQRATCQETASAGMRACVCTCTHSSCQLSTEHVWGPPSSPKCNLSLGPVSPWRPREGLWEEKGRDLEGRGSETTPARRHPLQLGYVVG